MDIFPKTFWIIGLVFLLLGFSSTFALTVDTSRIDATVAFPVERCFIGKIHVCNDQPTEISFDIEGKENEDWLVIILTGRIPLNNCADIIFTIEPTNFNPEDFEGIGVITSPTERITIPIHVKTIDPRQLLTNDIEIEVLDQHGSPMDNARIIVSSPYGPEVREAVTGKDGKAHIEFLDEFYIEVRREGYKHYFAYVFGPKVKIMLEPKEEKRFIYKKIAEYDTGFSVWLIKASSDGRYIVTSPGSHPGSASPAQEAYIMFFDSDGKLLWKYKIDTSSYENTDYCRKRDESNCL